MEIIEPNNLKSRYAERKDIERIIEDAKEMKALCKQSIGKKTGAQAIAHCQVTDNDPLRFFVTKIGDICINPKITKRHDLPIRRLEGCMSYSNLDDITVKRNEDISISYGVIEDNNIKICIDRIKDQSARIFQHEIDHFEGINIYGR